MKVYFLRHGETPAVEQGLIQGASDLPELNQLNTNGIEQVRKSTVSLIPKIKDATSVYIVQGNQWRVMQSTDILIQELLKNFSSDDIYLSTDIALKGRNYGGLEGLNEQSLRQKKNLIMKPNLTWPYILAQMGFENFQGIQPKKAYENKIAKFIRNMIYYYGPAYKDSAIIVSATSDAFKAMQQGEARKYCFFGDETIDNRGRVTKSKKTIKTGEIVEVEIEKPFEVGYDGKIETLAERRLKEKQVEKQQ